MICWHCGTPLSRNDETGDEIAVEYVDPIGNKHQLHIACAKNQYYKPLTANTPGDASTASEWCSGGDSKVGFER